MINGTNDSTTDFAGKSSPGCKPKPKTVEQCRAEIRERAKHEGGYVLIPYEMFFSEAYEQLSKSERLMLFEALAQLRYAPKKKAKRAKYPSSSLYRCGLGVLLKNGEFCLPTNYLKARGITGDATIARGKRQLVRYGFMDVVEQGDFAHASRFRYSDRRGPTVRQWEIPNMRGHRRVTLFTLTFNDSMSAVVREGSRGDA